MRIFRIPMLLLASLSMLTLVQRASAEPLDQAHVSADAKWMVHVDLDAFQETTLVEKVREKYPNMIKGVRNWLQKEYGINPQEDLHGVTLFGDAYKSHTGVVILDADYDMKKVKSKIEEKSGVETKSWKDYTIYTFEKHGKKDHHKHHKKDHKNGHDKKNDKKDDQDARHKKDDKKHHKKYGKKHRKDAYHKSFSVVLLDGKQAVFASSPKKVKTAVKLLEGDAPSLEGKDSELIPEMPEGTVLVGGAIQLQQLEEHGGVFPILQQHKRITYVIGEHEEETFEDLTLVARSEDVAEEMEKVLEGFVAFLKVWAGDSKALMQIAEDVEISRDDTTVEFHYRGDTEDVMQALQDLKQRARQWHHDDH